MRKSFDELPILISFIERFYLLLKEANVKEGQGFVKMNKNKYFGHFL